MRVLAVDDRKAMRMIVIRTFGFVTSESNPAMREKGLAAGASFLLTKPFDGERFADVVNSLVS